MVWRSALHAQGWPGRSARPQTFRCVIATGNRLGVDNSWKPASYFADRFGQFHILATEKGAPQIWGSTNWSDQEVSGLSTAIVHREGWLSTV